MAKAKAMAYFYGKRQAKVLTNMHPYKTGVEKSIDVTFCPVAPLSNRFRLSAFASINKSMEKRMQLGNDPKYIRNIYYFLLENHGQFLQQIQ